MKSVKVFIASSEELRLERLEIADMIQQLNRVLKPWDVEIDPLDNYDEYYRKLKNCEMCLVLYWTKFEDQTKKKTQPIWNSVPDATRRRSMSISWIPRILPPN